MKQYLDLLQHILDYGSDRDDRTGTGTRSVFGYQMKMDLSDSFPLLTTKKVFIRGIIHELIWLLSGETNIQYLVQNNVNIWNEWPFEAYLRKNNLKEKHPRYSESWKEELEIFKKRIKTDNQFAKENGELGPVYGKQWRRWETADGQKIDQISKAVDSIKNNPKSRRIIVSGWNVGDIEELVNDPDLAPPLCHTLFQFHVIDGKLSCQLYQRSADVFLGVPFNIASYALLTMMIAQVTGLQPGTFVHTFGDVHIYKNHFDQVKEQLTRTPKPLPMLTLNTNVTDIFEFGFKDITLTGYNPDPPIKAPISV